MGGAVGLPMLSAYVAAKHAANGLVRSLAAEVAREDITVNAIAPGSTTTAMLTASADVYGLPDVSGLIDQHLLDRPLHPNEIAAVVAFVCRPQSSGITGAVLPVDAGATSR
jgi:NAD(P)-dependent dehydrogenase (short-subunit alcohol dehydrogenase family)